ncbi:hypothetical protein HJG60_009625 [Phyllostomus discolor]|uniref:Uncharacterized protein n=1 Tax=Phyllostomus discolor TaxID=89673 RepID=A0A834DAX8_9CHIR|nr:hypothetical protein HJG60_009625 [Phyllostomus discolor]
MTTGKACPPRRAWGHRTPIGHGHSQTPGPPHWPPSARPGGPKWTTPGEPACASDRRIGGGGSQHTCESRPGALRAAASRPPAGTSELRCRSGKTVGNGSRPRLPGPSGPPGPAPCPGQTGCWARGLSGPWPDSPAGTHFLTPHL